MTMKSLHLLIGIALVSFALLVLVLHNPFAVNHYDDHALQHSTLKRDISAEGTDDDTSLALRIKELEQRLSECEVEHGGGGGGGGGHRQASSTSHVYNCNVFACSGHGQCRDRCVCDKGFSGKDCSIPVDVDVGGAVGVAKSGTKTKAKSPPRPGESLSDRDALRQVSLVIPNVRALQHDSHAKRLAKTNDDAVAKLAASVLELEVIASSSTAAASPRDAVDEVNKLVRRATRPLTLILGPDVALSKVDVWRMNIAEMVRQMATTDVDVLGMMTIEHAALSTSASAASFDPMCYELQFHAWRLRHRRAPFGYARHENFVMYCDRVSNTFMVRASLLSKFPTSARDVDSSPAFLRRALNRSFIGVPEKKPASRLWPLCVSSSSSFCSLFDSELGPAAWIDFFLRVRRFNDALRRSFVLLSPSSSASFSSSKTSLAGTIMVGACSESLIDIVHRSHFTEPLITSFAERHQVEVYFDAFGRRSRIVCVKSGGIYGHANRGLYSPLCHRLARQRDFVWIADTWIHKLSSARHDDEAGATTVDFSVSVHHGNLFGALRFQEELFWETDGDFDLIAHKLPHDALMRRYEKLIDAARKKGFEITMTYPEKPWYVAFKRDKTDFQLNARSPLSKQTRGKPPQVHNVSVPYQGRRVFMNGFANPWRSVRTDPGHDYRDLYLAQQGWVLHFTRSSVACGVEGHNACLPDCRDVSRFVYDHEWCSDDDITFFDRNPLLWFDKESSVTHAPSMPSAPFAAANLPGLTLDEAELHAIAKGETAKWVNEKSWQFL